jgi:hypothetical protein
MYIAETWKQSAKRKAVFFEQGISYHYHETFQIQSGDFSAMCAAWDTDPVISVVVVVVVGGTIHPIRSTSPPIDLISHSAE